MKAKRWPIESAIARIESLRGLTELQTIELSSNEISDLSPLAANPGLASGDLVDVRNNPLSITSTGTHVPNLRARDVNVRFSEIVEFDSPQTYKDNVFVIPVAERMTEINAHLNDYVDRVLERFGDVFDFVIFVPNRNMPPAYFSDRQNSVTGIGKAIRVTGGKLQGVVNMGGTSVIPSDLARAVDSHTKCGIAPGPRNAPSTMHQGRRVLSKPRVSQGGLTQIKESPVFPGRFGLKITIWMDDLCK